MNPLTAKVRSAHPGAYDDLNDADLTKKVLAKYPQYSDLAAPSPAVSVAKPAAPQSSMLDKIIGFAGQYPGQGFQNEYGANVNVPGKSLVPSTPEDQANQANQMVKAGQMVLGGGGIKNVASEAANVLPAALKARAGAKLNAVSKVVGNVPVNSPDAGDAALKILENSEAGGSLPKVINKYLARTTKPGAAPLDFDTARKFYQNAGDLSFAERSNLTPRAKYSLDQFRTALGNSIKDVAEQAGQGDTFAEGMSGYHRAMQVQDAVNVAKKGVVQGAKYAVPTAVGGTAAAYAVKKMLGLK